ncbi:MAG: phenylalanine--tRNA ligase subunit alpha [Deltaproteobacteria bacterium]|nr:phenylalanine--tRNA ligase subunit alpha [Deltaproteobacteria bacterium]
MSGEGSPERLIGDLEDAERRAGEELARSLAEARPLEAVESVRVGYLGKKGEVSKILKAMGKLSAEARPQVGQVANRVRDAITAAVESAKDDARRRMLEAEVAGPPIDVTLPGRPVHTGARHPVMSTMEDLVEVFRRMGFQVADGPEIEGDFYNFEALGIPADHPARDMQDTLFVDEAHPAAALTAGGGRGPEPGKVLLRTHTSPVQVRTMLRHPPPIRVICPGKVYRRDSDVTHTPMFHQIEGLWVEEGITMAHLKGTLERFARVFFGEETRIRLRPSYFQFTEPSAEVDVTCTLCEGKGCRTCSDTGWLEILGAGMVDPGVFAHVGYDPEKVSGFAFGMGVDRIALLRHRVEDLRLLFDNDLRFLGSFAR